ncbi:MAG: Rieske 2Fe-2S domain-containing protein [Thermoplasmataceae archaeon]
MDDESIDSGKRNFLKAMVVISAGAAVAGVVKGVVQNILPPAVGLTAFPELTLYFNGRPLAYSDIPPQETGNNIVLFDYPLSSEPNFLINVSDDNKNPISVDPVSVFIPATGGTYNSPAGVGPYNSVVAFSAICQHLGCVPPIIHYYPAGSPAFPKYIHCNCHGSTYDPSKGAKVVTGPTTHPLPATVLKYDPLSGNFSVVGLTGPTIYGKTSDLTGGTPFPAGQTYTDVTVESING